MSTATQNIQPRLKYKDLRSYLELLRQGGELHEIPVEVNPELEITEIYDRIVKNSGPALLFNKVKGSEFPLAINIFGSSKNSPVSGIKTTTDFHRKNSILTQIKRTGRAEHKNCFGCAVPGSCSDRRPNAGSVAGSKMLA